MRITLQTACEPADDLPSRGALSRWANAAARRSGVDVAPGTELVVRLVEEPEGAQLNRDYRGKPGPTNVLSFPFEQPPGLDLPLLGDVVMCVPVLRREAHEQGKTPEAHFAHMTVHATLHLLGHDHDTDAAAAAMEALEQRILAGLGFPDPYRER